MNDPYEIDKSLMPGPKCRVCAAIDGMPEKQRQLWRKFASDLAIPNARVAATFRFAGVTPVFSDGTVRNHRVSKHD